MQLEPLRGKPRTRITFDKAMLASRLEVSDWRPGGRDASANPPPGRGTPAHLQGLAVERAQGSAVSRRSPTIKDLSKWPGLDLTTARARPVRGRRPDGSFRQRPTHVFQRVQRLLPPFGFLHKTLAQSSNLLFVGSICRKGLVFLRCHGQ